MKLASLAAVCMVLLESSGIGKQSPADQANHKEMMRHMRMMDLTSPGSTWGFKKDKAFPKVFGVLVDSTADRIGTVTTITLRDGTASLYTTGSFGVIGAGEHKGPRDAAIKLVQMAQKRWDRAKPTKDFAYPKAGQVAIYLVGYEGVRVFRAKESDLAKGNGEAELYTASQDVVTQIRLAAGG